MGGGGGRGEAHRPGLQNFCNLYQHHFIEIKFCMSNDYYYDIYAANFELSNFSTVRDITSQDTLLTKGMSYQIRIFTPG